ncbi:carbohydrate ABC transporter permease [Paenibacillus koleovorans]|uniref:carbohydrate ABC transporter permease n=1 Tax=Paenibacillus koleovorans TaxID=121608 RepID=UPI000FDCC090|nr:carbohydrate ABC transporter permease [Paenibacillus koleovorans]
MKQARFSLFDAINICIMLGLIFVTLYPFVYLINVSLSSEVYVLQNRVSFWPRGFTTQWYEIVFQDRKIWMGYRNTILYVVLGTIISLLVTSSAAYALSKQKMLFGKQITLLIIFTILFSGGMIPSYLVAKELGIVNSIWAMVLPGAVNTFHLLIFRTFFEGIPEELEDAGRMDGLNDIGLFTRIVAPLSKPVYASIGLFVAVGIWNNFYSALIYLRDPSLFPLQVILRDLIIAGSNADSIASSANARSGSEVIVVESLKYATIIVSTLPILLVYPFLQKYFVKGVMLGSVKG